MKRIVLAYSGGLDSSVALPWLAETYGAEVVTVTMDLGQGTDLEEVRDRALAGGAVRAHVLDLREEFAHDYILPALKADAFHEDRGPMGAALGRPLIARKLVEIAAIEQTTAVAHGSTGEGGRQAPLDALARAVNPAVTVLSPARDWSMTRLEVIEYARLRGIPASGAAGGASRAGATLWSRTAACGVLENPWAEAPEEIHTLTRPAADCPDEAAYVEMTFERGRPTAINGVAMPLVELVASLGMIAGAHGVGRFDLVDNQAGARSREISEAPAAVVLHMAHRELQRIVTTEDADRFSRVVSLQYTDLVHKGLWFTPLREALDAYVAKIQERVSGVVRVRLFKGDCRVVGRKSPFAVYDHPQAGFGASEAFDRGAAGFIKISGLSGETVAKKA